MSDELWSREDEHDAKVEAEKAAEPKLIGKMTFIITENPENNFWYSELVPDIISHEPRDMYKLALLMADVQVHLKKNMEFIDQYIVCKEEVRKIHNELVAEKQDKTVADVDKYQTKLPFECTHDEEPIRKMNSLVCPTCDRKVGEVDDDS